MIDAGVAIAALADVLICVVQVRVDVRSGQDVVLNQRQQMMLAP